MVHTMAVNWSAWLGRWTLFLRTGGGWTFGQVLACNPDLNTLSILALLNRQFQTVSVPADGNVSEAWGVTNWSQYNLQPGIAASNAVGRWMLIRNDINQWFFGKVASYDAPGNAIRILSLMNGIFRYENQFLSPIVETWAVEGWTRLSTGGGSRGDSSTEPMP